MSYSDYEYLLKTLNFSGHPAGTAAVFGNSVSQTNGKYDISYSIFTTPQDIASAGYYEQEAIDGFATTTYKVNAEIAFRNIMQGSFQNFGNGSFDAYSVLFQDVANINFQVAQTNTGYITFGQANADLMDYVSENYFAELTDFNLATTAFVPYSNANVGGDFWNGRTAGVGKLRSQ